LARRRERGVGETCQVSENLAGLCPPDSKGATKIKTLKCRDVGFDCAAIVTAETVEEVLAQATAHEVAHAQEVHGVAVTAEMAEEIATKISG